MLKQIPDSTRNKAAHKTMKERIARGDKFYDVKPIKLPQKNRELAEFVGILLGDGSITKRQVTITLHKSDDADFTRYVCSLCKDLFGVNPTVRERGMVNVIVVSRTTLVRYLTKMGLLPGSKVGQQIDVPNWIKKDCRLAAACARGLFDTDGCFYVDKHYYKEKVYLNCAMNFTNRSQPLLAFFRKTLCNLNLHPTCPTVYSLALRRENEILDYFHQIGSSNPKHRQKFEKFFWKKGGVPKWS